MGLSTDALFFYGFSYEEDEADAFPWHVAAPQSDEWRDAGDWDDAYAAACGVVAPTTKYEEDKEAWREYWRARDGLVKQSKCVIEIHCSVDYPIYCVAIQSTLLRASRGYPELVSLEDAWSLAPDDMDNDLERFCMQLGIPFYADRTGWWLASDMG